MDLATLGITTEDLIQKIVEHASSTILDDYDVVDKVKNNIAHRTYERVEGMLNSSVEEVLKTELTRILSETVRPVDIWGQATGTPTTIREVLATRAKEFWEVKVDKEGKPASGWSGVPRFQHLMSQLMKDEFNNAVKENTEVIVAEFKKAVRADLSAVIGKHVENLMPSKR